MLAGKRILLIVGGGIAAYKTLELVRRLRERGAAVRAILTEAGAQFVTPLSLGSLTGDKVYRGLFDLTDEAEMGHIQLSRDADLIVVAPATADLMARMAAGLANDLAATALLATDKPVLIAPAMNLRMWHHPATQRNLAQLSADGIRAVGPGEGEMACGEYGLGRMAEPAEILAAIEAALAPAAHPLVGRRALVTAGPTAEPVDPVRVLTNRSSGKQGYAIAGALARLGAETVLVSGPTALAAPSGVRRVDVETAEEMLAACKAALPADVAVFSAAVADWRIENRANEKIKKSSAGAPVLRLIANPDILKTIAVPSTGRPKLVVGFAAETENLVENAKAKRLSKGCDWLIANDVSPESHVFGGEANTVHLLTASGLESWPAMSKEAVAAQLAARVAAYFAA
jgi:phosphopantothenoylcysteine decarboxylase / phosphopantothenate---cysteine ligase